MMIPMLETRRPKLGEAQRPELTGLERSSAEAVTWARNPAWPSPLLTAWQEVVVSRGDPGTVSGVTPLLCLCLVRAQLFPPPCQ